jgi:Flp pilus assembly protein TadG
MTTPQARQPLLRRLFRRGERTRGQSIVEFALILPVFLLLFGTTLDLGRIAAARVTVENAAREGAFEASAKNATYDSTHAWAGSQGSWNPAAPPTCSQSKDSVTCRALLEARAGSIVSITPWDVSRTCAVSLAPPSSACGKGMGNTATVTVTGRMALLTPILRPLLGGQAQLTFSASSTTQVETLPTPSGMPAPTPTPTPTGSPSPTPTPTPTPPTCTLPSAGFTHSESPNSMKAPVTETLKDTSTSSGGASCAITLWYWDFGDGYTTTTTTAGATVSHPYIVPGTFKITLTVTNPAGSKTSGAVTITVKA